MHPKIKELKLKISDIIQPGYFGLGSKKVLQGWINRSRKEFLNGAGKNMNKKRLQEIHDIGLLNNILHQAETINGFKIENVGQLRKILSHNMFIEKSGFLKDSKGFNKRSQIILTNGLNADGNFIRKKLGIEVKVNLILVIGGFKGFQNLILI